jgi:pyruvate kinase
MMCAVCVLCAFVFITKETHRAHVLDSYIRSIVVISQGVNTPDSILQISCLTKKDREDLTYMLDIGVDWVALSFVQRPEDIVEIKRLIMEHNPANAFPPHVMAKIEKPSCFVGDSLEKIVQLSDGISEFKNVDSTPTTSS